MPAQRLTMRRVRELLRLHYGAGASARAIARELGVSRSTVKEYLARAAAAELTWPLPAELSDAVLEERLFAAGGPKAGTRRRVEPDWAALVREMKRPGVNLTVLWEEYGAAHPGGYSYSRFCELYREFEGRLSPTMRQHHAAGEKVFVDYSGKTVPVVDPRSADLRRRVGRLQLHLRRGQLDPELARLDRRACPHVCVFPRLPAARGTRQFEGGCSKAVFLRSGGQPHIRPDGGPLRDRHPAGATGQTTRQSQSRSRGSLRSILYPRPAAPPHLLLAGRMQRRDRDGAEPNERAPDAPPRHQSAPVVRGDRAPGSASVAGNPLRLRRVAPGPRRARLSRRDRQLLLFGAARPDPPAG